VFVPRYSEAHARDAVARARSYAEALRLLGMRPTGANGRTLAKYVRHWGIPTDHFDPRAKRSPRMALEEILVERSTYSRGHLKERLYASGLKQRQCELCGQGELWRGRRIALILDHVNGVGDDHRLENLRIVCPNCAAALPTHCGRNKRAAARRECPTCTASFVPRHPGQRYCSRGCVGRGPTGPRPERRKVERPAVEQLRREVEAEGYCAVARRYGVSDNAVRKWFRAAGVVPPRGTWPNRRRC
jgi:hypothetical protein